MGKYAIRVQHLGKKYTIGASQERYKSLRDSITRTFTEPIRRIWQKRDQSASNHMIWALKDVSFDVGHGEVVGIIGRNGAGKSTLLKLLARITEPTEGEIRMRGRVGSLLEVGTGFHPELTGRENIYLNGAILGMSHTEIQSKFDAIVDFAETEKFLDTPAKHYSSGMYMRLAFSVAAHLEPEILIIDEVLAVGDTDFQKKCLGKIEGVAKEGRTVLFVSHNMGLINEFCSRAILINKGLILDDGLPNEITRKYLSNASNQQDFIEFPYSTKDAFFRSLMLLRDTGERTTNFEIQKPVILCMKFFVKTRIPNLQASIALFNDRGHHIFYHSSGYVNPPLEIEEIGEYDLRIQIPGNLLTPGSYTMNVALHIPNVALFEKYDHVISFDIHDTGSKRYDYDSKSLGLVLVDLEWEKYSYKK